MDTGCDPANPDLLHHTHREEREGTHNQSIVVSWYSLLPLENVLDLLLNLLSLGWLHHHHSTHTIDKLCILKTIHYIHWLRHTISLINQLHFEIHCISFFPWTSVRHYSLLTCPRCPPGTSLASQAQECRPSLQRCTWQLVPPGNAACRYLEDEPASINSFKWIRKESGNWLTTFENAATAASKLQSHTSMK